MGNFIRDALAGRDIVIAGDGTAMRSYLYGTDLAIWLLTVLVRGRTCRPYNVGGAEAVSIAELARLVSAEAGRPDEVLVRTPARPGAPRDIYLPDLSRTTGELGLRVTVDLRQAVKSTLDWYAERQK